MGRKRIDTARGVGGITDALFGGGIGLAAAFAAALLLPLFAVKSENAIAYAVPIAALSLFIGGVVGGYIGAYRGRSIVAAVASGGVMLLPIVLISLFISGNGGAFGILLPLCGLAAGIAAGSFVALKRRSNAGRSIKRAMKRR